jgi:hypothetical protein
VSRWIPLFFLVWSPHCIAEQLPDPTMPDGYMADPVIGETEALPATEFKVTEIVLSSDRRIAVINGQRVTTGDEFAGGKVVSIQAGKVTIDLEEERVEIPLVPLQVKKPADISRGEK